MSLNIGNLMHRSVFPHNLSSSFSQKMHSGGNSCMADEDNNLWGERTVEALSLDNILHFKRSWFFSKLLESDYRHPPYNWVNLEVP